MEKIKVIVREDINKAGRLADAEWNSKKKSPAKLIALALNKLSLENASFDMNPKTDELIKSGIQNFMQSWVIPPLEEAYDKLTKKSEVRR